MTPGLVSVVVASFNHAEYLATRMQSLLDQTYREIEILVIDDCSTDHSVQVLRQYEQDPRVKVVVREANGGWVVTFNQGIDLASGEYLLFANCDDDCDPRMIERLVAALTANPSAGLSFCRSLMVDEQDRVEGDDFAARERAFRARCATDALVSGKEMGRFLLDSCVIPNMSAALIRQECFSSLGHFTSAYRACGDWDLFFRIAERYDMAYVAEPLNKFRQHPATIRSTMKARATYEEYFRLLLGQIRAMDLTFLERCRYRTHVMYLWAVLLISPSWSGVSNFASHFRNVVRYDPWALLFFGPGLMIRVAQVLGKLFLRGRPGIPETT